MPVYDVNGVTPQQRPRVVPVAAHVADACQGCGNRHVKVYEINCRSWITRLCRQCAEFVASEIKRMK